MAGIHIDGKPYEVNEGGNLLQAALSLGFDLPYFCWHPALGSVGACRQCAVKQFRDEKDTQGRIVMACMTPAAEGTRISIDDPEAGQFRAAVVEWLMVNHPHDCPVCDEGGECHLQDMTVMTGHNYREFRFKKRTHRNQDLGPFVNHEMNRCIACYRCVRFYRDYAGGRDFDVFGPHDHVYFGRYEDGVLENEFSGNLIEVCPTGVFTDKTLKQHYTRKWDLQTAPSICVHCGLGCNTIPGERYGGLGRIMNRYHHEVNGYFLCDRGRFGYEFVNSERRLRRALVREKEGGMAKPVNRDVVLATLAPLVAERERLLGIGSPRASLEANFALRTLVGPEGFTLGMSENESRLIALVIEILRSGPARPASLRDVELSDAVLVLGEDVTNTAPMAALALQQTVRRKPMKRAEKLHIPEWDDYAVRELIQQEKGPLFIGTTHSTKLDSIATKTYRAAPADLARLGFAVARAISPQAPAVSGLTDEARTLAGNIAQALKEAERPLLISGTGAGSEAVIQAAANVAQALCEGGRAAGIFFAVPECNSLGLGLMGGGSLRAAFRAGQEGKADTVIILENDLYRRAESAAVDAFLGAVPHVVFIDHLPNATAAKAGFWLPAATFAEGDGTLVNNEGRAQRYYQVFVPEGDVQESWRWLRDVMIAAGRTEVRTWQSLDDVISALTESLPVLKAVTEIAPPAGFRVNGQRIPRQSHRYSGRTAVLAHLSVHEPKPPEDPDSPLSFSMEGCEGQPPGALIPRFWAPGWNSIQSLNKFQSEVAGPLEGGDPGRRLIEPDPGKNSSYFREIPEAFRPRSGEWLVVAIHHIFGSEELSVLAPGIAELAPRPYLALSPEDATSLRVADGMEVNVVFNKMTVRLPVKVMPTLPDGVAGLPAGLPGLPGADLPIWGKISRG